jgi:hypothetical protein
MFRQAKMAPYYGFDLFNPEICFIIPIRPFWTNMGTVV